MLQPYTLTKGRKEGNPVEERRPTWAATEGRGKSPGEDTGMEVEGPDNLYFSTITLDLILEVKYLSVSLNEHWPLTRKE